MLKLEHITKNFAEKRVLSDINIEVDSGEVFGLIGSNGAGKTTLMNIITRILPADGGRVLVDGCEIRKPHEVVGKMGYMLDIPSMFEFLTAYEMFEYLASPLNMSKQDILKRADYLLELVDLKGVNKQQIKTYSRGMKQRMGIAAALVNDPNVVLMDEPTSALDPQGRYDVVKIIERLKSEGKCIILSTHILSDVEKVCSKIGILAGSKIVVEGKTNEVISRYSKPVYDIYPNVDSCLQLLNDKLSSHELVERIKVCDGFIRVQIPEGELAQMDLFSYVSSLNIPIRNFSLLKLSLDDIFRMVSVG